MVARATQEAGHGIQLADPSKGASGFGLARFSLRAHPEPPLKLARWRLCHLRLDLSVHSPRNTPNAMSAGVAPDGQPWATLGAGNPPEFVRSFLNPRNHHATIEADALLRAKSKAQGRNNCITNATPKARQASKHAICECTKTPARRSGQ